MRWEGHVACIGEMRNMYKILVGNLEGKRPVGRYGHKWEVILKCTVGKYVGRVWIGVVCLRSGTGDGLL
jgi:hypothetical protein